MFLVMLMIPSVRLKTEEYVWCRDNSYSLISFNSSSEWSTERLGPVSSQHWPGLARGTLPAGNWFDEDSQWTQDTDACSQSLVNNAVYLLKLMFGMDYAGIFVGLVCYRWSLLEVEIWLTWWALLWAGRWREGEGCSLAASRQSLSDLDRVNITHV